MIRVQWFSEKAVWVIYRDNEEVGQVTDDILADWISDIEKMKALYDEKPMEYIRELKSNIADLESDIAKS